MSEALQVREQSMPRNASAVATDHRRQHVDGVETSGKGRYDPSETYRYVRDPLTEVVCSIRFQRGPDQLRIVNRHPKTNIHRYSGFEGIARSG